MGDRWSSRNVLLRLVTFGHSSPRLLGEWGVTVRCWFAVFHPELAKPVVFQSAIALTIWLSSDDNWNVPLYVSV